MLPADHPYRTGDPMTSAERSEAAAYELWALRRQLDAIDAHKYVSCPKCGKRVLTRNAFTDQGSGAEAGRTFYYCSEHCRETH